METMTPMDFLEFRDLLRPASCFQRLAIQKRWRQSWDWSTRERYGKELLYFATKNNQRLILSKTAENEKVIIACR
jgi:tryptophan 2,3-dioxygenase